MFHQKNTKNDSVDVSAFTLVELVVSVLIIIVLGLVGLISYNSYLPGVRDSNRLTQMEGLNNLLKIYSSKDFLPLPDDYIQVKSSGSLIAYQGYIGAEVLDKIQFKKGGLDPKDEVYFSYYVNKKRKYYQILGFMEEEKSILGSLPINSAYADEFIDYSDRYIKVLGNRLGILTEKDTNLPIQEVPKVKLDGEIDIGITSDFYRATFIDKSSITGTGVVLGQLKNLLPIGGRGCSFSGSSVLCPTFALLEKDAVIVDEDDKIIELSSGARRWNNGDYAKSCNSYLHPPVGYAYSGSVGDGIYWIKPGVIAHKVFCDMTTNGGGWTLLMKGTRGQTFEYHSSYWTSDNTLNETDVSLNDADAKYQAFNDLGINHIMARWPDLGGVEWLKLDAFPGITALEGFNTYNNWGIPQEQPDWNGVYFSSQAKQCDTGPGRYGTKLASIGNSDFGARWGYRFNEDGCGDFNSDDAGGGIGLQTTRNAAWEYSAGDWALVADADEKMQRSARFELYGKDFIPPSGDKYIVAHNGGRRWSDDTFAASCYDYLNPASGHIYGGATGNGVYWVEPESTPIKTYCDMDGGGWMLLDNFASTFMGDIDSYGSAIGGSFIIDGTSLTAAGWSNISMGYFEHSSQARVSGYLQMFAAGATNGYISKILPSYGSQIKVYWGDWMDHQSDLKIDGVNVSTNPNGPNVYVGTYNSGDEIRFYEDGAVWPGSVWIK